MRAVQAINFKLVPLEHRVLVVNVVALGMDHSKIVYYGRLTSSLKDGTVI